MKDQAVSEAFCSTANLGAGFDVFGLALRKYSDKISVRLTRGRKIRILVQGEYSAGISRDPSRNSAGPPARELLRESRRARGLEIVVEKNVPQGLGLGSSGSTAAACTKCLSHLLQLELSSDELVRIASLGEKAVSGTAHMDNVGASLLGGFVIAYDEPPRILSIRPPDSLQAVVATPLIPIVEHKTRQARRLVPAKLATHKAILNVGRASAIAAGFAKGDIARIGSGMMDEIAEPYRAQMVPGYHEVREAALASGAAGVSISGAGPSIIALLDRRRADPRSVGKAMTNAFSQNNTRSRFFVTEPARGARILSG